MRARSSVSVSWKKGQGQQQQREWEPGCEQKPKRECNPKWESEQERERDSVGIERERDEGFLAQCSKGEGGRKCFCSLNKFNQLPFFSLFFHFFYFLN